MPRLIVEREMPVARSTNPIPPCPNAIASLAAHTRRDRSFNTGRMARNFRRNVVRFTPGTIALAPLQINQLFLHNPLSMPVALTSSADMKSFTRIEVDCDCAVGASSMMNAISKNFILCSRCFGLYA
jgi:hypothetical protein